MAVYKRDIVDINLETGNIHRSFLKHSIGYKDQKADHFGIRTYRDGVPVDLTGVSVQGIFLPPQGDPIAITSGNIVDGNVAEVVLPQACYNYDGQFTLSIKLVDSNNSVTGTMRIVDGMVDNTHASGTVAPTSAVPTYQEILSTYDEMVAATAAANGCIAATYSSSSTYKVGDYCIHDGGLYRCTTAITTAEAWTSGHWTAAKIGPDVSELKSAFGVANESIENEFEKVTGNRAAVFIPGLWRTSTTTMTNEEVYFSDGGDVWVCAILPCNEGDIIKANVYGGSGISRAYYFADSNKKYISCSAGAYHLNGEVKAPSNAKYIMLNNKLELMPSGYFAYNGSTIFDKVGGMLIPYVTKTDLSEIAIIQPGKNLINYAKAETGAVQSDGTIRSDGAYASYITSDYIPVTEGAKYTFTTWSGGVTSTARKYAKFFDAQKNPVSGNYTDTTSRTVTITAPTGAAYIRVSSLYASTRDLQLEKGETSTSYQAYYQTVVLDSSTGITTKMETEIETLIAESNGNADIIVTVGDSGITMMSDFAGKKLKRTAGIKVDGNKLFEFGNAYISDNGVDTSIKSSGDDITPLRLKWGDSNGWTVGANHGWFAFEVAKGNLTTADIGSTWTSGGNTYVLAQVGSTNAVFIPMATISNHKYQFSNSVPTDALVHDSGATHTGNVSVSDATSGQLYPSVNNHSIKFMADGRTIESGTFACNRFTVVEEYNIIDFADLGTYLHSHIGGEINDDINGCVKVSISYDFTKTGCLITTGYEALKAINYYNCGTIQAQVIGVSGTNKRYFYTNNQNNYATLKSSVLYDATSDTSAININSSNAIDENVASNRFVELIKNASGDMLYGFVHGYLPDISRGADSYRKSLSKQAEFRVTTLKSYPVVLSNLDADVGDFFNICCYRNYLEPSDLTNVSVIPANNATYLIIDAHVQQTNRSVEVPYNLIGKTVTVVESHNFTLKSDVVGGTGVTFSTSAAYGCAVLKIA